MMLFFVLKKSLYEECIQLCRKLLMKTKTSNLDDQETCLHLIALSYSELYLQKKTNEYKESTVKYFNELIKKSNGSKIKYEKILKKISQKKKKKTRKFILNKIKIKIQF